MEGGGEVFGVDEKDSAVRGGELGGGELRVGELGGRGDSCSGEE